MQSVSNNPSLTLSNQFDSQPIKKALQEMGQKWFFQPSSASSVLKDKLKNARAADLNKILNDLILDLKPEENEMKRLESLLKSLEPFISWESLGIQDSFKEGLDRAKEATLYFKITGQTQPFSKVSALISSLREMVIAFLETLMAIFGLGELFKPVENEIQADMKSSKIMTMISFFGLITPTFLPLLGAEMAGMVIGGFLLGIAFLSLIWPLIKPRTTHLPANAENWTREIQRGVFVAQGRKESLDKMARILESGKHPILVGPSRVGKSLTAKAFAKAIEQGDYPGLKGKTVFRINTADIVNHQASFMGGGNTVLNKISAAMGKHRRDIIVVFDEIHMACKDPVMADKLKPFLDQGGEFPFVIGITTEEEYEGYVKHNSAFANRFEKVKITDTNESETLKILNDVVIAHPSHPLIEDGVIEYIYAITVKNRATPQPITSLRVLDRCIQRLGKAQKSQEELEVEAISSRISALRSRVLASHSVNENFRKELINLEESLRVYKGRLQVKQEALKQFFRRKELLDQVVPKSHASALKIRNLARHRLEGVDKSQLKMAILWDRVGYLLEKQLDEKDLGVKFRVNRDLVDEEMSSLAAASPHPQGIFYQP